MPSSALKHFSLALRFPVHLPLAKMQLNDAAKGLHHHDDIATSLMVNSRMGFKRYNLSNFEVRSINVEGDVVNILNSIGHDRNIR